MSSSSLSGRRVAVACVAGLAMVSLSSCQSRPAGRDTLVMLIESSPNNLDLRQGTDAQSERIGGEIYDALVRKDEHFNLQPWLATSWEQPDPLTWIFHLRDGVRFHDGKPMEAADVAWSIDSMTHGLVTAKGGAFADVLSVDAPDRMTVVVHTRVPVAGLLFNLSDGLFGVVERGAGKDEGLHPIGTGPFKFVSQVQDKDVIVERNTDYWAGAPKIAHVRFEVVPDTITTALMIKKGAGDAESNVLTPDMVNALEQVPTLRREAGPSSMVMYANFNVTDPMLRDRRVRQAIAYAIDRQTIVNSIWHGEAQLAYTLLPIGHWAAAKPDEIPAYSYDPGRAKQLLDDAGFPAKSNGVRLRLTIKTSTDETTRELSAVLQQQLRAVGIDLQIRSAEFGTFYADVTHGAFQMYILRWIGSNEDPDFFRYVYASTSFPPKGSNRGHYSNPKVDALLQAAAAETDLAKRRTDYVEVQRILATDVPSIPLWYPNNELVHSPRVTNLHINPGGTFDFLRTAELR